MSDRDDAFPMDIFDRDHPTHRAWNFRPRGFLVVMLTDAGEAERAEAALAAAGFAPSDLKRYDAEEIVANFAAYLERIGAADKLLGTVLDDVEGRDRYVAYAREGLSALWARIPDEDRVPKALRVLADFDYRHARYYGDGTRTDLEITPEA
jgi:hypothetical protein